MTDSSEEAPQEYEELQFVLVSRAAGRPELSDAESDRLQQLHLSHLKGLRDAGDLIVSGSFFDQGDEMPRGMCVYRVGSVERARELAGADPKVSAGQLAINVMGLRCRKGVFPK